MRKFKFVVQLDMVTHDVILDVEDDVTREELNEYLNEIVWDEIHASYEEL